MNPRPDSGELDAGPFAPWLASALGTVRGEGGSDVPCGTCTACCRSSQFVIIRPDEADALAHIPAALRFPAPRLPEGYVLMGYDEHGRCPMLAEDGCSIYAHRPQVCRDYDCRVFAATGLPAGDPPKPAIEAQVARWRFSSDTSADRAAADAVRAAASYVSRLGPVLFDRQPVPPSFAAAVALELADAFTPPGPATDPDPDEIRVEIRRRVDRWRSTAR